MRLSNPPKWAAVFNLCLALFVLTACGGSSQTSNNTPTPTPTQADDQSDQTGDTDGASGNDTAGVNNPDTLAIDNISQPRSLDPAWAFFTADIAVVRQIYERLVDYKGGATTEFEAQLAVEPPTVDNGGISQDFLTYTLTLRDGVTFWDGSPLACEDVEYSFERAMAMDHSGGGSFMLLTPLTGTPTTRDDDGNLKDGIAQKIADAVSCDGNTATFKLQNPFPPFIQVLAHGSYGAVYSKAFAMKNGAADNADPQAFLEATNNPPEGQQTALYNQAMGSGPYQLNSWDRAAEQVILTRYEDYRNGPAAIKNVIFASIPEFNTRLLRLKRGDADISVLTERSQVEQLKSDAPQGVRLIEHLPGLTSETMFFNMDIGEVDIGNQFVGSGKCDGNGIPADFFADVNVRKAFVHAFDQETFISDFLQGAGQAAATPVPPQIEYADASITPIPFDLEAAAEAFKAAQCDGQSVWDTGFSFTAAFDEGNTRRKSAFDQLVYNIESLNAQRQDKPPFSITVISQPAPVVLSNIFQDRALPMYAMGWSPDYIDIDDWIRQWMDVVGGAFARVNGLSTLGDTTTLWTQQLDEAIQTLDEDKRKQLYAQLQQAYVDQALAVTMPTLTIDNVERGWVNGNYYSPGSGNVHLPPSIYALSKQADAKANTEELNPYKPTITEF